MLPKKINTVRLSTVVFCYGGGGHQEQMMRLAPKVLNIMCSKPNVITLSDVKSKPAWSHRHYVGIEARNKYGISFLHTLKSVILSSVMSFRILVDHDVRVIVSTGPGIAVIFSVIGKLFFNAKVVHVETWSRFCTRSWSGRIMYRFADVFYVQNKSLISLYPKAKYSGLL